VGCAKLLTMAAITFTWASADFDRRHSTSEMGHLRPIDDVCAMSAFGPIASLIGRSGSSAFRPTTTTTVSMSLTGSCFSSESAPGPSIMGVEDEAEQSTKRPFR
jgi:hypothetical protein